MARFFEQKEADPQVLKGKKIAVVGYGNQGRAQAINLCRAGHEVMVSNQRDSSWDKACEDGFDPVPNDSAASRADIVMMLLPDEIAPEVYARTVRPNLNRGKTLVFNSGYNIT